MNVRTAVSQYWNLTDPNLSGCKTCCREWCVFFGYSGYLIWTNGMSPCFPSSFPCLIVRLPSFMQFSRRWSGVPWMIAGGADRIQSGSSTNPNPPEYGGSGPEWKGAVSCWDAESGLEVMGRREERALPVAWHKMNYCHLSAPLPHSESRVWRAR